MWIVAAVIALMFVSTRKGGLSADQPSHAVGTSPAQVRYPGTDVLVVPSFLLPESGEVTPGGFVDVQVAGQHKAFQAGAAIAGASITALAASLGWTAAAGPIGAAVAGVVIMIDLLRSTAHLTANDFVKRFQNPFGRDLALLLDPHDARMAAGTESYELAGETYDAILFLWEAFQFAAAEYARHSNDAALVVRQGLFTLNGPNGLAGFPDGFINTVLAKLERETIELGNPLGVWA